MALRYLIWITINHQIILKLYLVSTLFIAIHYLAVNNWRTLQQPRLLSHATTRPQARNTIRPGDQLAIAEHLNITFTIYITINHIEQFQWFILSRPFTQLLLVLWCWGRVGRVERLLSSASAALVWKVRPSPGALPPCCRWPCVALDRRGQRGRGDVATYQSIMEVFIATSL